MTTSGLDVFDTTMQKSNEWLNRLTDNKHLAYSAFRSVCHALRDRLMPDLAVNLGAQMPMLLRGMYYEGWKPSSTPTEERHVDEFLSRVADGTPRRPDYDAQRVAKAVFLLLAERVSPGEIEDIVGSLPRDIKELWPQQQRVA